MAIAAAREVRDYDIVFAGTGLPMLGIMVAQYLHAPNSVLIYEAGICDGKCLHVPGSVTDQRACYMASALGGLIDTFGYYLQRGLVDLGGAAIDKYGNVNVTYIGGTYYEPTHRFAGSGGNGDIGTMSRRVVYIMLQEKRRFLEKNPYVTTCGWWSYYWPTGEWKHKREIWAGTKFADYGPEAVVSTMAVWRFDREKGEMYVELLHPSITKEQLRENCGFEPDFSRMKGETPPPTYRQLVILRELAGPERIFLPEPLPEYPDEIKRIVYG